MKRGLLIAIAAVLCPLASESEAGEIVTKTWYNHKGEPVKSYVYDASRSLRHFASPRQVERYRRASWNGWISPFAFTYYGRPHYYYGGRRYYGCRPYTSSLHYQGSRVSVSIGRPAVARPAPAPLRVYKSR